MQSLVISDHVLHFGGKTKTLALFSSFNYHFPISYVSLFYFFLKKYQEGDEADEAVTDDKDIEVKKKIKRFCF